MSVGDPLYLTVSIEGDLDHDLELPEVAGVRFTHQGQSSSYSWINGRSSKKISHRYLLSISEQGEYIIPAFIVSIDNREIKSNQLSFSVVEASSQIGSGVALVRGQLLLGKLKIVMNNKRIPKCLSNVRSLHKPLTKVRWSSIRFVYTTG